MRWRVLTPRSFEDGVVAVRCAQSRGEWPGERTTFLRGLAALPLAVGKVEVPGLREEEGRTELGRAGFEGRPRGLGLRREVERLETLLEDGALSEVRWVLSDEVRCGIGFGGGGMSWEGLWDV